MYHSYRAMKAAGRASVQDENGEVVLTRIYLNRENGTTEEPRIDVAHINFIFDQYEILINDLRDLKALASDIADLKQVTIQQLRLTVSEPEPEL